MNRLAPFLALLFLTGCLTVNDQAGKTLASIASTVDVAMKGWATYVVINKVSDQDQAPIRKVYSEYQAAMTVADQAYVILVKTGNPEQWKTGLVILNASQSDLISTIGKVTKGAVTVKAGAK